MNYSDDLCKLVINNMDIIEEAPSVVEEIEKELFKHINKRIKEKIDHMDGWDGVYELYEEDGNEEETLFIGPHWPIDDEGSYLAWYALDSVENIHNPHWLTCALGEKGCGMILNFNASRDYHGKTVGQKKIFFRTFLENNIELKQSGVVFEDGCLGIPFHLEAQELIEDYPKFDESLKPLDEALDKLIKVHPHFDTLVKELPK